MASVTTRKVVGKVLLANGRDPEGNIVTVNLNMPSFSKDGYDDNNYLEIVDALEPCLSKSVEGVTKVVTSLIAES